jgi:hypothetical protein
MAPVSPESRAGEPIALTPAQARLRKMVLDAVQSPHSKRNYAKALDNLFAFCASRPLSRSLLMEWRAGMESLSPSTINVRLSAVRKLVGEARRNNMIGSEEAASRMRPAGLSRCFRVSATARSIRSSAGVSSWRSAEPAAVGETLRVVRASSCNPKRFSRPLMEWLKADCETPRRAAARVKLRSSATTAKAESSPKSFFMIHEFYS